MIKTILAVGKSFDWISPILAVAGNIANGPAHVFLIPQDCGWTGREIANLLKKAGIKTWGLMAINDVFTISVRKSQAQQAQAILDQNGIPTEGRAPAAGKKQKPEYKPGSGWSLL